jgi:methylated-DNA-[protein]-cysteine S-methyltransferase
MKTLRSIEEQSYPSAPTILCDTIETPRGPLAIGVTDDHVVWIRFGKRAKRSGRATPLLKETRRQLKNYLAGRNHAFDLPLRLVAPRFTASVLASVSDIPFGETMSYADIAGSVGNPRAARAVGQAVGANPIPIVIPCHRVLAAHGRLGGFGGGLSWKRFLLDLEGVEWLE